MSKLDKGLVALLVAFICLATVYSMVTPPFEAPDEKWHYAFVKHLADGGGLPVLEPQAPGPWQQEGGQPPLYYALAAFASRWAPSDDLAQVLKKNSYFDPGIVRRGSNPNIVIHTEREAFPYRGAVLAIHLARGLSVVLGALTVLLTYALNLEILPRRPGLALAAAAMTAFTPMFLFISGSVNNDNLIIVLATAALWQLLHLPSTPGRWALLGATMGLAALAKTSALSLLPLAAAVLAWNAWQRRDWRLFLRDGVCLAIPMILVAGWWYYRNWRLYGDPTGLNVFLPLAGAYAVPPSLSRLLREWSNFPRTYWGLFGWNNVAAPAWFYWLLNSVAFVGAAGLMLEVGRRFRRRQWPDADTAFRLGLVTVWPLIVMASLISYSLLIGGNSGRLLFPAIGSLSYLLVLGLASWSDCLPRRKAQQGLAVVPAVAMLGVLAVFVPFRVIAPAYARPPLLTPAEQARVPNRLDLSIGQGIELLGYQVGATEVKPGDDLPVTLYWRARAPMNRDYSVFVHLLDKNNALIVQHDACPGQGTFPTTFWRPGDAFADTYMVPIPRTLTRSIRLKLVAGFYHLGDYVRLPVRDGKGETIGDCAGLGEVLVRPAVCERITNPVNFNLGNQIALVGYNLDRTTVRSGETFHLTLFWKALAPPAGDYTAFNHLLGPGNAVLAQKDLPLESTAPTGGWQAGEVLCDSYELIVQPDAPAGAHDLEVGLYRLETMDRLSLLGPDGRPQGDRILLPPIRVTGADGR